MNQCPMPARPETAMIAQRTPRACNKVASIASGLAQVFGTYLGLFLFVVGQDCSRDSRHQGRIGEYFVWNIGVSDPVDALGKSPIRLDELIDG